MTVLEKLHSASYENVAFLVSSETVDRGKKVIYHEYPNSDIRYVEELGKNPPIFTLTAIVHGPDALNRRYQLENALEKPGLGELVHPIYGVLQVKVSNFSVNSSQADVGQFTFSITFAQSRENITPSPSTPTESEVSDKADKARDTANQALENLYKVPRDGYNFESAMDTLQNAFDQVHDRINTVVELSETGASAFNRTYRTVTNNIGRIVSSAQNIRENVASFYAASLDAPEFTYQLNAAWKNLMEYPLIIPTSSPLTRLQSERQQNEVAIVEHMKIMSLISAYEAYAYTDFNADTDLTAARQLLNDTYKDMFNGNDRDIEDVDLSSIASDSDMRDAMSELIISARKVFDEKEKTVFRITEIKPGLTSMPLATYRYYGDLNNLDAMVGLNPTIGQATFNTLIKAITI